MTVEPRELTHLHAIMKARPWISAWGHENTLAAASATAGFDLRPLTPRPALELNAVKLPSLKGQSFKDIWLLSPDYTPGFRPQIGTEVTPDQILGWQILKLSLL